MKKDIEYLDMIMNLSKKELYDNYFCWLYPFTNENIKAYYEKLDFKDKKVLSVTSSGDHIINSICCGAKEIDSFDSNPLAKYYSELKIAAIKSLSLEEFILFFYNKNIFKTKKHYMNKNMYFNKIRENLNEKNKYFWDYVFNKYTSKEIYKSYLFTNDFLDLKELIKANIYLTDNKYKELKKKLTNVKITYYDKNIKDIADINKKYDLIILSNIPAFIDKIYDTNHLINLKKIIDQLKTGNSTVILNYYYDNMFRDVDKENLIYDTEQTKKIFPDYELYYFESFNNKQDLINLKIREDAVLMKKNQK